MENWRNIIPLGLILPFLIIIVIEYSLNFGLNWYSQKLDNKVNNLEVKIKQKEEALKGVLETNQAFKIFSQAVNITEILKTRSSLSFVINKFNQLMPKFLSLQNFRYDADKNEIAISASVPSWQDYIRFHKYIAELKDVEIQSFTPPKLSEKNTIDFSMVLILKPNFYQQ
ncbi:MAG: hypothetical protein KatS3mg096_016 [Candidatus Parcubacteria bacterium]|nr:MAG: hypothetical protein KatS3mg096_016 [Candidatus Parcubacteria bacterium]